jgi:hypothetical protein
MGRPLVTSRQRERSHNRPGKTQDEKPEEINPRRKSSAGTRRKVPEDRESRTDRKRRMRQEGSPKHCRHTCHIVGWQGEESRVRTGTVQG